MMGKDNPASGRTASDRDVECARGRDRGEEGGMAQTYEELKKKTIDELREIAKGIDNEAVKGYTQMNKEHLLPAVCKALGIDTHVHHPHAAKPGVEIGRASCRERE